MIPLASHETKLKQNQLEQLRFKQKKTNAKEELPTTNINNASPSYFQEQSKNAFLRLDSTPYVEEPLLPDKDRRQIWLKRHQHNKLEKKNFLGKLCLIYQKKKSKLF